MPAQRAQAAPARKDKVQAVIEKVTSPFYLRLFFLTKLPLALVAGLRVRDLDETSCRVCVPYGWRTTNPFKSTYFAALSMAAELSTGLLADIQVRLAPESVAMLIVGLEAQFEKKATGTATFTCEQGDLLAQAVSRTLETGEPATAKVETVGRLKDGTVVARFSFTWSFKRRTWH
ncbi:MAG TPA: DUF4442 domain-containing protein [Acidobacteriota bacterium]|nr:DUF4442 domain-containing protein [Acidobacteriota bacterium]